jgi:hypothetical protein
VGRDLQLGPAALNPTHFPPTALHQSAPFIPRRRWLQLTRITASEAAGFVTVSPLQTHPGLEFASPQHHDGWWLKKGKETTIEFFTEAPGMYEFTCSVVCGIHHGV